MSNPIIPPTSADCVGLLRSLQQLGRARRRSTKSNKDAVSLSLLGALDGSAGVRISVLAEQLMVDVSAASRQLSALEIAGLIARVTDDADHRAQLVRLTPAGESALARACESAGSDIARRISSWSERDVRELTRLLEKLAVDLVASEPGCARTQHAGSRQQVGAGR